MRDIVLITVDSVRADHCSFMGYKRETTPFLDKIVKKEGIVFKNAISPGNYTSESMICAFTGDFSHIVPDAPGQKMSPKPWRREISRRTTIAQILAEKGYFTAGFSPNPMTSKYYGFDKGFKYFQDFLKGRDLTPKSPFLRFISNLIKNEEFFIHWENYYQNIINLVKTVKTAKSPLFLWVFLIDTHTPYNCPRYFKKYSSSLDLWKVFFEDFIGKNPKPKEEKRINLYDDSIRYVDKFIETLWYDLEDLDLDPVFIIHSDHGEGFGEHGHYGHGEDYFYEENIHIPLLIIGADMKGKVEYPCTLLDLPIVLNKLSNDKISLNDPNELFPNRGWVISKTFDQNWVRIAVRTKEYKYILKHREEFYNLKEDPHEQENKIGEFPELENELRKIAKAELRKEEEILRLRKKVLTLKERGSVI